HLMLLKEGVMKLIRPRPEYLASYKDSIQEDLLYRTGSETLFGDPDTIIENAYNQEHGIGLKPGYVMSTTLWLIDKGIFIGEVHIRHELTPALLQYGGHIGYEVRYTESRKGYGTKMLDMALDLCRNEMGLARVLITCDDDNIGSAK